MGHSYWFHVTAVNWPRTDIATKANKEIHNANFTNNALFSRALLKPHYVITSTIAVIIAINEKKFKDRSDHMETITTMLYVFSLISRWLPLPMPRECAIWFFLWRICKDVTISLHDCKAP